MRTGPKPRPVAERFERFWIPEPNSGCHLWLGGINKRTSTYWQAFFDGKLASRAAWSMANGPIPTGMCVLHRCDNPMCVNPDHLFLGTLKDNSGDMMRKGRGRYVPHLGESHGRASVTEDQVKAILSATGRTADIARQLGISYWIVWGVRRGRAWRHVT